MAGWGDDPELEKLRALIEEGWEVAGITEDAGAPGGPADTVKLTKDGVPVVIHDATLDRTTPCTGQVNARTLAELRANCPSDILGTDGNFVQLAPGDRRRAPIPTLAEG